MKQAHQKGFTIVELLIVIVVIGILAAIVIVSFNGIQSRARDTSKESSVGGLMKGIELYNAENGNYPSAGCADNNGCAVSGLTSVLVPTYIAAMPNNLTGVSYARSTNGTGYGLNVPYEARPRCVAGTNPNLSWGWFTSNNLPLC